jgi:DNA-binding FrmR family transcriptional regulator
MAKKDKDKKEKNKQKDKSVKEVRIAPAGLDFADEIKRLNRITGQIEAIGSMLSQGRKLDDVLIQCKAVHSALRAVEARVMHAHLQRALEEAATLDKRKDRAEKLAELEALFKQAA